jgi:hypothetical protein
VNTDLDRLELELRCVPGVVAVGFDRDDSLLLIQTVVLRSISPPDLRARLRRVIDANVREPVNLEVIVDDVGLVETP